MDVQQLDRIARAFEQGALDPSAWGQALDSLQRLLGANGALIFNPGSAAPEALSVPVGTARHSGPRYAEEKWFLEDPWILAAVGTDFESAGRTGVGEALVPLSVLHRTRFHAEFASPLDTEGVIWLRVCDGQDGLAPVTHLSLYRPPGAASFSEREQRALCHLWPSLRRAVHLHFLLAKHGVAGRIAADALESVPQPLWLLRADGRIDFANRAGTEAMRQHAWAETAFGRLMTLGGVSVLTLLRQQAAGGAADGIANFGRRLCRLPIYVSPVAEASQLRTAWPLARHLVTVVPPQASAVNDGWLALLAERFGLTRAEQRLLRLLAAGHEVRDIADQLGISLATARTHLAAIFTKTGQRRQADLVRLALGH
jgi:DNA-binding CsgD family transcriptional regulator